MDKSVVRNPEKQVALGNAAQYLYNNNSVARAAMNHPYAAGAVTGIAAGAIAYAGAAALTSVSVSYLGGAGTSCIAFCGQVDKVQNIINESSPVVQVTSKEIVNQGPQKIEFTNHAIQRMAIDRGVSPAQAERVIRTGQTFDYLHRGVTKTGYYDVQSKVFVAEVKGTGKITTVITNVGQRYVNNLIRTIKK